MVNGRRRSLILGAALAGCAGDPLAPSTPPAALAGPGRPVPLRTLTGGFLAPTLPGIGQPVRPGSGAFVRWTAPGPLALRGQDLLVADLATARLWRTDMAGLSISGTPDAPVAVGTALALGPDLSAWVLDPTARRVLRFARDGRLLQSHGVGVGMASPVALALADGGVTLLLADGLGARWSEQRGPGGVQRLVEPQQAGGRRIGSVDALVPAGQDLFVLDRQGGVVHRVSRGGEVLATTGQGVLKRPVTMAADRLGRVYVHEAQGDLIVCLDGDTPPRLWRAAELGVRRIGGLAVDGLVLALSDALAGSVVLHTLPPPEPA